jgi:hypothetical protein
MEFFNADPDYARYWEKIRNPQTLATLELAPGETVDLDIDSLPIGFNDPFLKPVDQVAFDAVMAERSKEAGKSEVPAAKAAKQPEPTSQGATEQAAEPAATKEQ